MKEYPKTDSSLRKVVIPQSAQVIMDCIKTISKDSEFLFEQDQKRITGRMFNYYLEEACKKVAIEPRSTHKVRKTYASKLLLNDVDVSIVLKQMGHKDIATTNEYYHYDITTDTERYDIINQVVNY